MKRYALLFLAAGFCLITAPRAQVTPGPATTVRFMAVDLFVDSGREPLAAYQLDFGSAGGTARIVGVEGGAHPAFKEAPYYDPAAMQQERVILAAFNTASPDQLPQGKTRVATIHLQITGAAQPGFNLRAEAAGNHLGNPIPVQVSYNERTAQ